MICRELFTYLDTPCHQGMRRRAAVPRQFVSQSCMSRCYGRSTEPISGSAPPGARLRRGEAGATEKTAGLPRRIRSFTSNGPGGSGCAAASSAAARRCASISMARRSAFSSAAASRRALSSPTGSVDDRAPRATARSRLRCAASRAFTSRSFARAPTASRICQSRRAAASDIADERSAAVSRRAASASAPSAPPCA